MPVFPEGVPTFTISEPSTIGDSGHPSDDLYKDAKRVLDFIQDERHLTAEKLLESVTVRVTQEATAKSSPQRHRSFKLPMRHHHHKETPEERQLRKTIELLDANQAVFEKLHNRCRLFRAAQRNLDESDDWILASKHFGITTYYRREPDGSLSIKLTGEVKGAPLFEQIAVLKEVDLHKLWAPFCTSSLTIADLDKLDTVGWFMVGMPNFGLARDGCFRAIGCDNIEEDGSVILAGTGIQDGNGHNFPDDTYLKDDPILAVLPIPDPPTRLGSRRMTIRSFDAVVHVTSPTSVRTKIFANINPNLDFLPESLIEFAMKHLAGVVLAHIQKAAKKATNNPETNAHAKKMREESDFYQKWLMKKFAGVCRAKNWDVPHVAALSSETPVVNMAAVDRTARRLRSTDNMSEISMDSSKSSVWSNNPVKKYLKQVEEKARKQKEERIKEVRQRAADRLKRTELNSMQHRRLQEFQVAKNSVVGPTSRPKKISNKFSRDLHQHDLFTRSLVVLILVITLFTFCYPTKEMLENWFAVHEDASWKQVLIQSGRLWSYTLICAVPHYLVCKVVLVYALDTLEFGKKLGFTTRDYYSDNVRRLVAAGSLGIVLLSMFVAATKSVALAMTSAFSMVLSFASTRMHVGFETIVKEIPPEIKETSDVVITAVTHVMSNALSIGWSIGKIAYEYTIEPTFVGIYVSRIAESTGLVLNGSVDWAINFVQESQSFEWKSGLHAFSVDSCKNASTFFAYSATFLMVTVTLYSAYLYSELIFGSVVPKTPKVQLTNSMSGDIRDSPIPEDRPLTPVTDNSSSSAGNPE